MLFSFSDNKKRKIINSIQNGLAEAKVKNLSDGLTYENGAALHTLNFVFKHIDKINESSFELYSFKRGPYQQTLIYDKETKTLISLTSQNNINRLKNRNSINRVHYIDSLLLFNDHIPTTEQLTIFDDMPETWQDDRERVKKEIQNLISQKDIKYYMVVEYQIHYKSYSLYGVKSKILSPDYFEIDTQNWGELIKPNYDNVLGDDIMNNVAPEEQKDSPYVKQKELSVRLKTAN